MKLSTYSYKKKTLIANITLLNCVLILFWLNDISVSTATQRDDSYNKILDFVAANVLFRRWSPDIITFTVGSLVTELSAVEIHLLTDRLTGIPKTKSHHLHRPYP
jgi:hypothetical protein